MKRTLDYSGLNPVVMLCRNALGLTKSAVESVLAQDIPVQLHIVDNDSTDGTDDWIKSQPGVILHTFRPALGVSAGWNFALTTIFRAWDHCLVVNNDLILRPDTYSALLEDGGEFVTAVSVNDPAGIQGEWRKAPRPHPDFSCFLIRKSAWQQVGAFDEAMALYASDADYHLRMHRAGIEAYTIGIPFFHYASGTLKSATVAEHRRICDQADRDRERFAAKWLCEVGSPEYYQRFGHGSPDEKAEAKA